MDWPIIARTMQMISMTPRTAIAIQPKMGMMMVQHSSTDAKPSKAQSTWIFMDSRTWNLTYSESFAASSAITIPMNPRR